MRLADAILSPKRRSSASSVTGPLIIPANDGCRGGFLISVAERSGKFLRPV